jgi:MFS family permease
MPKNNLFVRLGISKKPFFIIFVLLIDTFIWFFINLVIISKTLETNENSLLAWSIYLIAIVGSSLLSAHASTWRKRFDFIYIWLFLGIVSSFLLSFLTPNIPLEFLLSIIFFSGVAFGLGMPATLAYFAEYTAFENRGRISGIIFLATNLGIILFALLLGPNLTIDSIVAVLWRGAGLIIIVLLRPTEEVGELRKTISFRSILSNRAFILFLIPWFMFCLIDRFHQQIFLNDNPNLVTLSRLAEPVVGTISALVGGILSDWIGRKKVIVFGFVALGLAYAVLGFASGVAFFQYFYIIVDAVAWGIFLVSFLLVLWGDLSSTIGGEEKYYAVGSVPFFIAYLMQYLVKPYIKNVPAEVSFSFASLFLFIAVLPLIFAPETLPEKKIQERQLKKYVEEAKKAVAKEEHA